MATSNFKQLLFSQYITSGAQVSIGVGAIALGVGAFEGAALAVTAASGAVCVSIVDQPGPVRLKALQLFSAALLTTLLSLIVSCLHLHQVTELLGVFFISILSGLLNVYGKKAIALSFVVLFALVIGIGSPKLESGFVEHAAWFGIGALLYASYALLSASLLSFRTKRQALAESVFELAHYLDAKAAFFQKDADLNQCYSALVGVQVSLIEKQQAARDLVFRRMAGARHVRLARILIGTLDISERVFASHTDYGLLHEAFAATDVMMFLRDLAQKAALDLRRIGYAILRGREAPHAVIYKAETIAIRHELERLGAAALSDADRAGLLALEGVFDRLSASIALIGEVHAMIRDPNPNVALPEGLEVKPFLSGIAFAPSALLGEFSLNSPVMRFAIRLTLAMVTGWVLAHVLPYSTHSYWILLTVAVILRANYSVTRQRRNDRILGTLLGCVFIAALLHFKPGVAVEVLVLLVALGFAHAFAVINYRYTAAAACVLAVLQVHFLNPGAPFAISERLVDTLVGALLAFLFSFVLPSWEHLTISGQVRTLMKAHARYVHIIFASARTDNDYRLARKSLFDTIALTSATFRRMLNEPRGQQRAVSELNDFITTSYTFASRMTALHHSLENVSGAPAFQLTREVEAASLALEGAFALAADAKALAASPALAPDDSRHDIEDELAAPSPDMLLQQINEATDQARWLVRLAAKIDVATARPASSPMRLSWPQGSPR
jgi:uncharacterized membrane protein YccC